MRNAEMQEGVVTMFWIFGLGLHPLPGPRRSQLSKGSSSCDHCHTTHMYPLPSDTPSHTQ